MAGPAPKTLAERCPVGAPPDELAEAAYEAFVAWTTDGGVTLYPAQDEALLALATGANVVLGTPTGSGKSLVAVGACFAALSAGQRSWYTAPIKALVSEKFFDLCAVFGATNVGMMTGDATVNAGAPIVCATAEILANTALREGAAAGAGLVVMDEFHFYGDPERGWAWQVPLLTLPDTQFLLMSATLGDTSELEVDLTRRTGRETIAVTSAVRPVPLDFAWVETPIHESVEDLLAGGRSPVYAVHFTQAAALERAQALTSAAVTTKAERAAIAAAVGDFRFAKGFGQTLRRLIGHGIGVHHAGMLPKYRRLVETLAQAGLLKVVCGTDTLGVGINVPIRTVLLTSLVKYDGTRMRVLRAREFHQIAGRAGRAGFDVAGSVVCQAPDHVVENARLVARAGDDPKKLRRVQRKKPPEGELTYGESTFERLVAAEPEPLRPHLRITHAVVLNILQRPGNGLRDLWRLIHGSHEEPARRRRLWHRAVRIVRTLLTAQVVRLQVEVDPDDPARDVVRCRVAVDLQQGFALNQPLSAFALEALKLLDPDDPAYPLDVVSVVEATLEDPRPVLAAQRFEARGEAVAEFKADGLDYDERMTALEDVSWPRPLAELLEGAFLAYLRHHPWAAEAELSPKSVVREMWERAMSFGEFIAHHKLARSEGLVLRYLSDAYRALRQTVPATRRTDELDELTEWLGEVVRQTDSSLLDEWETLVSPADDAGDGAGGVGVPRPTRERVLSDNPRALRAMIRQAMFRRVELLALGRYDQLAGLDDGLTGEQWQSAAQDYFAEYADIGTGPDARGAGLLSIEADPDAPRILLVAQIIDDPDGDRDWRITAEVDLDATDEAGELALTTAAFAPA